MVLNERQQSILALANQYGEVKVNDLKDRFKVTEMTIRRDLEKLEKAGSVRRVLGGAIPVMQDVTLHERTEAMQQEKEHIGRLAADLVQAGESIFIDAGSTTLQVARHLNPALNITVVTNALNVAAELMKKKISTIVIGGVLLDTTASMAGPNAIEDIQRLAYDRVFIGATGLSAEHGFSNSNMYEAEVKRTVIQQAEQVNAVLDHSKYGAKSLFSFAALSEVHQIITDQLPQGELLMSCKEQGVNIII